MNENQYNSHANDGEIDLRELILVLWKKKIAIICVTLIAAIIAGVISVFLIKPVYHSNLRIVINMPQVYNTKYGDYTLYHLYDIYYIQGENTKRINYNEQYINLITSSTVIQDTIEDMGYDAATGIESVRGRISIESVSKLNSVQNTFNIKVASNDPADAKKLAQTLYDNYIEFLDMVVIEGAIDHYINEYNILLQSDEIALLSEKELLANNEELLASIPQFINQKEAMKVYDSSNTDNYIIIENILNPTYIKVESDIMLNKQNIHSIENSIRKHKEYLDELDELKSKLNSYRQTDDYSDVESHFVRISKVKAYLSSEPATSGYKTSPNNTRNVIIGAFFGGIIAVFVVLIREYWFKPYKKTEDNN